MSPGPYRFVPLLWGVVVAYLLSETAGPVWVVVWSAIWGGIMFDRPRP